MGMKVNGTSGLTFPDTTTLASAGQSSVRAWVNFNGTGTVAIRAAYNVASITDNGTGTYAVNFTTALADANYAVVASGAKVNSTNDGNNMVAIGSTTTTISTTAAPITNFTESVGTTDNANMYVAVFR